MDGRLWRRLRSRCRNAALFAASTALAVELPPGAEAHVTAGPIGGFASGLEHPFFGLDHLIAMLAVGIWGAQMGGRRVWTLPVTFPLVMAVGGVIGMAGVALSHIETGVALSMLAFGAVIAFAWRPPEWVALGLVAVFAICHGYAHGVELPNAADPAAYAVGFVIATGTIHVIGIGVGLSLGKLFDGRFARGLGGAVAAAGLYFLVA
jgi:urease accessory protein